LTAPPLWFKKEQYLDLARRAEEQFARRYAVFAIVLVVGCIPTRAQTAESMAVLASRSSIIVLGTVTRERASEEPLVAPTSATAVIKIRRMFAGSEFAGDQDRKENQLSLEKGFRFMSSAETTMKHYVHCLGKPMRRPPMRYGVACGRLARLESPGFVSRNC
jgi:hypothetical protein